MKLKYLSALTLTIATLSLCGCNESNNSSTKNTTTAINAVTSHNPDTTAPIETTTTEPATVYNNDGTRPDVVNFYIFHDSTGTRDRLSEFYGPFVEGQDIRTFAAFTTADDSVYGSRFADMWFPKWEAYSNSSECKIGYKIHIYLKNGDVVEKNILSPTDVVYDYTQYVETWIYDDVHHAAGQWYSHLTEADMNNDTVITSVKLTCGPRIGEVDYIVLDTFVYTGKEQFDENGDYIGPIKASVKVNRADTESYVK